MNWARVLALVGLACAIARADLVAVPPDPLPVFETTLGNQLHVLVAPDPTAASIVVHVRYRGGVADEQAPFGSTHLIERLMFAGSVHVKDGDFEARLAAIGGWASSEVTADHLSTFEEAPPEALELALWLEAERMAGLAEGLTDAGLARERAAIVAERRAAYVDHPYGLVARAAQHSLWGDRANGHDPLADGIDHLTRAQVTDLVRARVSPEGAVLVIAGRVEPQQAIALARTYFGWIPPRGSPAAATTREHPEPLAKHAEVSVADPVPKVVVAFRTDAAFTSDAIALEVGARILAGGRTSRLWRALVDDRRLATEVHADVIAQHRGGELRITAIARPGVDPAQLAAVIDAAIADLRDHEAPAAEVQRAVAGLVAERVTAMENLAVRASAIADWSIEVGSTDGLVARLAKLAVNAPDVKRAAARWLADSAAVTVIGR